MKKPITHKCLDCGNVYYYRKTKFNGKCPVCRGLLQPEGYRRATLGLGLTWTPDIPMPPVKPMKKVAPVDASAKAQMSPQAEKEATDQGTTGREVQPHRVGPPIPMSFSARINEPVYPAQVLEDLKRIQEELFAKEEHQK